MADDENDKSTQEPQPPQRSLTLEQALLAPLDSILKAQLHSARSFLNMLLQLGYPHNTRDDDEDAEEKKKLADGKQDEDKPDEPYHLEFAFSGEDDKPQKLRIPALSLVPISPLAVDSAEFELEMAADEVVSRTQLRSSSDEEKEASKGKKYGAKKRPWFLVDDPLDIKGEIIAPSKTDQSSKKQTQSSIKINIQVKSVPMPAGLNKLLTTLTAMSEIKEMGDPNEDKDID